LKQNNFFHLYFLGRYFGTLLFKKKELFNIRRLKQILKYGKRKALQLTEFSIKIVQSVRSILLTNSMGRSPPLQADSGGVSLKTLRHDENLGVQPRDHKSQPLISIINQFRPLHILTQIICLNIILPCTKRYEN
jgi:hypothetical protein